MPRRSLKMQRRSLPGSAPNSTNGTITKLGESSALIGQVIKVITSMWREEYFEWDSPTFNFPRRMVTPKPFQDPHPPCWMAATSEGSSAVAGMNQLGGIAATTVAGGFLAAYGWRWAFFGPAIFLATQGRRDRYPVGGVA